MTSGSSARAGSTGGGEHKAQWEEEIARVEAALKALGNRDRCLELACGTGLWTRHLARICGHVTAADASPEVIALNRARLFADNVDYIEADLFDWRPSKSYDLVFFSFWLSHVPQKRLDAFWDMVRGALVPGGTAFLVESLYNQESTASDHAAPSKTGCGGREGRPSGCRPRKA